MSDIPCGYSCDDCIISDILFYDSTGGYYGIFTDGDTGQYYRSGSNPCVTANHNRGCNQ